MLYLENKIQKLLYEIIIVFIYNIKTTKSNNTLSGITLPHFKVNIIRKDQHFTTFKI